MPQTPPDSIWRGSVAEAAVAALEQSVKELWGDRNRIYLTGLSMGAHGTWTLALKRPTMFAAVVAVCGGLLPSTHFTSLDSGPREADLTPSLLAGWPEYRFGCFMEQPTP